MDLLQWLNEWYKAQCNGDWEHCYGVTFDTLDNPGWRIQIDIEGTVLEEKIFEVVDKFVNDSDWIFCRVKDGKFDGGGDPDKLFTILEIFKNWAEENKE